VHQCRILLYMGKPLECVTQGLDALSVLEERLPSLLESPTDVSYENELLDRIVEATKRLGIAESFQKLPILQDEFLLAVHSLIIEILAPSAFSAPHLLHTLTLLGVLLTFKHGKCIQSAVHVLEIYAILTVRCQRWLSVSQTPTARKQIEEWRKQP
jgi:hypothetical protein